MTFICFLFRHRWAKESSRGLWYRHGCTRDRESCSGDTVSVQEIPEEKGRVQILVSTSQFPPSPLPGLSGNEKINKSRCMYRNSHYLKVHQRVLKQVCLLRDFICMFISNLNSSATHHFPWCSNKTLGWSCFNLSALICLVMLIQQAQCYKLKTAQMPIFLFT